MAKGDRAPALSRRAFVARAAAGGAALMLGVRGDEVFRIRAGENGSPAPGDFAPNQWIRIDRSGAIVIAAAQSEMGQGVRTALPMIVADELGADWSRVTVEHARPGPAFRDMRTSGSGSVEDSWRPLRLAAAAARQMLVAAAATQWGIDPTACRTELHHVVNTANGNRLAFGDLVGRATLLAVPTAPAFKPSSEYRLIGQRVARVDGPLLVDGRARFGLDVRPAGMAVAMVVRAPQHGATVKRWDDTAARAVPGFIATVQVPTGVAVIANGTWPAMRARDALRVEWNERDSASVTTAALQQALASAIDNGRRARREGADVDLLLSTAHRRLDQTYTSSFQAHATMEPMNCIADVHGDRCELWVGTQAPNQAQEAVAKLLGIPLDNVTVNVTLLGGGFGRRLDIDYAIEAAEVSRAAKRPVQVVWTREDDVQHDRYQPAQLNRLSAAIDMTGKPSGWRHRVADYNLTMFGPYDPNYDPAADGNPWGGFDTPYAFDGLDVTFAMVPSPVPTGAWRSVAYPAAVFARESFLDEVAHATGKDPVALRLSLVPSPGLAGRSQMPNGDRLRHVIELAADQSGWHDAPRKMLDGRRWGRGFACNSYHNGTMVAEVAEVSVGVAGDIRVHRVVCAVDCGRAINRWGVEGQFESGVLWGMSAALKGKITFTDGRTDQSNFDDFPIMRFDEAPVVEVHIVPSELRPMGLGEPPVPPVAPAIGNAIFAATGVRLRDLPFRAEALRS